MRNTLKITLQVLCGDKLMEKLIMLLEYLDRTGKHVNAKTIEKYKNENRSYSEWVALNIT